MRKILLLSGAMINGLSLVYGLLMNFSVVVIAVYCCSLLLIIYGAFFHNKKALKIITVIFSSLFVLFIAFTVFVCQYGQNDNVTYEEDALIVLGAKVNGETPSLLLAERLNAALQYYDLNPDIVIVVSGGQGPNEAITEALAMERYLMAKGVPADKIIREERSTTTVENFVFSKELLDSHFDGLYKTVIVTNDFHIFRSNLIAEGIGMESSHVHAKIPLRSVPANYLRETIAIVFQILFKTGQTSTLVS